MDPSSRSRAWLSSVLILRGQWYKQTITRSLHTLSRTVGLTQTSTGFVFLLSSLLFLLVSFHLSHRSTNFCRPYKRQTNLLRVQFKPNWTLFSKNAQHTHISFLPVPADRRQSVKKWTTMHAQRTDIFSQKTQQKIKLTQKPK